jgi:hypothetical protein
MRNAAHLLPLILVIYGTSLTSCNSSANQVLANPKPNDPYPSILEADTFADMGEGGFYVNGLLPDGKFYTINGVSSDLDRTTIWIEADRERRRMLPEHRRSFSDFMARLPPHKSISQHYTQKSIDRTHWKIIKILGR